MRAAVMGGKGGAKHTPTPPKVLRCVLDPDMPCKYAPELYLRTMGTAATSGKFSVKTSKHVVPSFKWKPFWCILTPDLLRKERLGLCRRAADKEEKGGAKQNPT